VDDHPVKKVRARVMRKRGTRDLLEMGECGEGFWFGQPPPSLIKQNKKHGGRGRTWSRKTKSRPVEETDQGSIDLHDHHKPPSLSLSQKQVGLSRINKR
jgi:hypothetical protein